MSDAVTPTVIPESEVDISAMRAQGAGGQNVNKVSSAIHLRFDIPKSSLADDHKARLLALPGTIDVPRPQGHRPLTGPLRDVRKDELGHDLQQPVRADGTRRVVFADQAPRRAVAVHRPP